MTILNSTPPLARVQKILILLGCISVVVPLIGFLITGTFMRYSGDDYCYGGILTQFGFWKAQWISYWTKMPYHGNRFSLTLFSDLSSLIGPQSNAILPGLAIILLISGFLFMLIQINELKGYRVSRWLILLFSLLVVFFSLYQAPNLAQSLYWRSGMFPYLAPIILNLFIVGFILQAIRKRQTNILLTMLIGFLSLLAGGFSETATSLQTGFWVLVMAGLLLLKKKEGVWNSVGIRSVSYALLASVLAMILLAVSPSIDERLAKVDHPDIINFISISLRSALAFIFGSLKGQPIPNLINFFIFVTLAFLNPSRRVVPELLPWRAYLKILIIIGLIGFILVLSITAPSAYAQAAYPELRSLFPARLIMVVLVSTMGQITGYQANHWLQSIQRKSNAIQGGILILAVVLLIYPIYASRNIFTQFPQYQKWASFWDARDLYIRQAKQAGQKQLEVIEIDHIIPGVGDLSSDPGHWYNLCAAQYYDVSSITANQPGWDE
jgi:hypothetical protein